MSFLPLVFPFAVGDSSGGNNFGFYIVLAVILGLMVFVSQKFFTRRAKAEVEGVVGEAPDAFAIRLAPAPPFPDDVARLRALVSDASPEPMITRYTVPVVTADADALSIADRKIGHIVSVPAADITSVSARVTPIKPKGPFTWRKYPSLWLTVKRDGTELSVALTPIVGAYTKVSIKDAEALAAELARRLSVKHG